jgi:hypothetical protein
MAAGEKSLTAVSFEKAYLKEEGRQ